jgi:hypothetical protein
MRKKGLVGWMDYDKEIGEFRGNFYFKRPTTRHIHSWIVARKVKVIDLTTAKGGR